MSKRIFTMLAAIVALAAVAAGCGGDNETLTKAQFIKQADAICKGATARTRKEFQTFVKKVESEKNPPPDSGKELGEQVLLPNIERRAEELSELEPPTADEAEITAWLDELEQGIDESREEPASLLGSTVRPDYKLTKANKMAREYGLKFCGAE